MSLRILSITKAEPAAPYGDATRKRPLNIVIEKPNGETETFRIHESNLDELGNDIKDMFPKNSPDAILAALWGLWKHRKRGASLASIIGVDIEQ